ncbi:MAG TPA: hypothetical protein VGE64_07115 [Xanthomonadaceae bacterium]
MKNVSREFLANLSISLPLLARQKRIVANFDQLAAPCEAVEKSIGAAGVKQGELLVARV